MNLRGVALIFYGEGGPEGGNVMIVEVSAAVGIAVDAGKAETGSDLSADLLLNGMGKLHAAVFFFQDFSVFRVD